MFWQVGFWVQVFVQFIDEPDAQDSQRKKDGSSYHTAGEHWCHFVHTHTHTASSSSCWFL